MGGRCSKKKPTHEEVPERPSLLGATETCKGGKSSQVMAAPRLRFRTMGRSSSLKYRAGEPDLCYRPPQAKTQEEKQLITKLISSNPNLKKLAPLSEEQIRQLVDVAWKEVVPKGTLLMSEGDLNNAAFYIVAGGSFEIAAAEPFEVVELDEMSYVSRPFERPPDTTDGYKKAERPRTVRKLVKNAMVGDSSMYYGTPRWSSVLALERSEVWVISQANFKTVQFQATDGQPSSKTVDDEQLIIDVLTWNENLQRLTHLTERHIKSLAKVAWKTVVEKDQVMMREGDLNADALYIVGDGSLEFTGTDPFVQKVKGQASFLTRAAHTGHNLEDLDPNAGWANVGVFGRGICFGEISMLYCAPRFATIVAQERSTVWGIDRSSFQMVQMKAAEDEIKDRVKYLSGLKMLESFSKDDKQKVAGAMETMRLTQGQALMSPDQDSHTLYIILKGSVLREVEGAEPETLEADSSAGVVHYIGEHAIHGSRQRSSSKESVKVTSETAMALVMEKDEFHKVWDRLMEARPSPAFARYTTTCSKKDKADQTSIFAMNSMKKICVIAAGASGAVELLQHTNSKDLYVLKNASKGIVVQKGLRKSIMRERDLWVGVVSPYITKLFAAYNEPQNLSFLVEPMLGGELSEAYEEHNLYGSVNHARYYTAAVVLALEHLHKRRIIFRAVQPQNVLLDDQGTPKLCDMALAKLVAFGQTFTVCGTPAFMAPEILSGIGHTRSVDWWALGVMIHELMTGSSPFESDHPMEIYSKVMRGFAVLEVPKACEGACGELIGSLLKNDPIDRLAMRQGGLKNVVEHPWFAGFDWVSMRSQTMDAPYEPKWPTMPSNWKDLNSSKTGMYLKHFRPAQRLPEPVAYEPDISEEPWDEDFATVVETH